MKNSWFKSRSPEERSPFWWLRWIPTVVIAAIILYLLYVVGSVEERIADAAETVLAEQETKPLPTPSG